MTTFRHPLEWYRNPDGRGVDGQFHLLDRQMIDPDGVPVSTVNDIEIAGLEQDSDIDHDAPSPTVSSILVGTGLLVRIFGGRIPRSRWSRLEWRHVARVGTVIDLRDRADDLECTWLERWFRERIIARIPGGRHAPE